MMNRDSMCVKNTVASAELAQKYGTHRLLLLLPPILTLLNTLFLVLGAELQSMLGMSVSFHTAFWGALYSNRVSGEYYIDKYGNAFSYDLFFADALYAAGIAATVLFVAVFVFLFFLSGKRPGAYLAATLIYGLDLTALIVFGYFYTGMDAVRTEAMLHVLYLILLIWGCILGFRWKRGVKKEQTVDALVQDEEAGNTETETENCEEWI